MSTKSARSLLFDGTDKSWPIWSRKFKSLIDEEEDLLEILDGRRTKPANNDDGALDTWTKANRKVYNLLILSLEEKGVREVMSAREGDGKGAWDLLVNRYQASIQGRKATLMTQL